jgi:hypothetical protein
VTLGELKQLARKAREAPSLEALLGSRERRLERIFRRSAAHDQG